MALINRISRLFSADFNAVLDRIEEPDVLLKHALREMEEDVHSDTQKLKSYEKEHSQIETHINGVSENIEQLNKELDICFDSNEVELARNQVKKKLEMQRYEKHMKNKLVSIDKQSSELKIRINENKTRLTSMQQKLELLTISEFEADKEGLVSQYNMSINDNDVEIAFLREKQVRSTS